MLILLSPAKTLNLSCRATLRVALPDSQPQFPSQVATLVAYLQTRSKGDLKTMMKSSDAIASLNFDRYQSFASSEAYPAAYAYDGPAYRGLDMASLTDNGQIACSQHHLRILSGLYGVVAPCDHIKPYRLEMGSKVSIGSAATLYAFWGAAIALALNKDLSAHSNFQSKYVVNLCSAEYWKAVDRRALDPGVNVINCVFRDNGRVVSVYAKRARGLMARHLLLRLAALKAGPTSSEVDDAQVDSMLRSFSAESYAFDAAASKGLEYCFSRVGKFAAPAEDVEVDESAEDAAATQSSKKRRRT